MVSDAGAWRAMSGTALGSSHVRRGMPNQDAVAVRELGGTGAVAALSDGHGGVRYVRSDVGARLAVETALEAAAGLAARLPAGVTGDQARRLAREALGAPVVARWRERVLAHLASRPFTPAERERAGAPLDGEPLISYGATLLVAVATPTLVVAAQIGDGDLVVARRTGEVVTPVPGDERLVGGETTSLCLPDAAADLRVGVVEDRALLVLLASDGYGNAFADAHWRPTVVTDLGHHLVERGDTYVAASLPTWLAESAEIGGDDVSVALLHCVDGAWPGAAGGARAGAALAGPGPGRVPRPPGPVAPPTAVPRSTVASPATPRRWSTGAVAAALAGGLVVGGGTALALGRGSGATPSSTTVVATTRVATSTTATVAPPSPVVTAAGVPRPTTASPTTPFSGPRTTSTSAPPPTATDGGIDPSTSAGPSVEPVPGPAPDASPTQVANGARATSSTSGTTKADTQ